jgi:hypothetical protein
MRSGKAAMSASAWGNALGNQFIPDGQALKARLSSGRVERAFSAGVLHFHNPGALPQVRHGESVLWRTLT